MKKIIGTALACILFLSSCRGVEMVPPPQPSQVPSSTPSMPPAPTSAPSPIPPANEPIVGTPIPHNRPTQPFDPKPGDTNLKRGNAFIDSTQLLSMGGNPPQYNLLLAGNLPTPCNKLRVEVMEPDQNGVINIDAYSLVSPDKICSQVVVPFQANIPLGTFPSGSYTVAVNHQEAGKIKVP
jgi:hypothetical protein